LLPEITQTCKVCREWARSGPSNAKLIPSKTEED